MRDFFSAHRTYVFAGIGLSIALVAWWTLFSGDGSPNTILTSEGATGASVISEERDLVDTLLQLRAVSLSGTIFSDPSFARLIDFGTQIIPEPVGRPNPFAPYVPGRSDPRGVIATSTQSANTQPLSPQLP